MKAYFQALLWHAMLRNARPESAVRRALHTEFETSSIAHDGGVRGRKQLGDASENSVLMVTIAGGAPKNLSHSDALFGIPSYGEGLTSRLYYPKSHDPTGCDLANLTQDPETPVGSFVYLFDRGGCPFTTKIRNAQQAGAVAAIVIDDSGLCGRSAECGWDSCNRCPLYSTSSCECTLPFMGADGAAGDAISIPSMLVGRDDGADLRVPASLGKSSPPHALTTMRWDIPSPDGKVRVDLWFSPNDSNAAALRAGMKPYWPHLGPNTHFTPRPFIFDGRALGCAGPTPVFDCGTQCTNDGWYCALDPDGDMDIGVTGGDVVHESVRSMCIAAQTSFDADGGKRWWAYSDGFQASCNTPAAWTAECSYSVMKSVGLDVGAATSCVEAANATVKPAVGDWTNTLLGVAITARANYGIVSLPAAMVNDILLRGSTNPAAVLLAICSGYAAGTKPPVCSCLNVPTAGVDACVAAQASTEPSEAALPAWAGVLIAFAAIGAALALGASVWSYYANRRMAQDVEGFMDDYRALVDENSAPAGHNSEPGEEAGVVVGSINGNKGRRGLGQARWSANRGPTSSSLIPTWLSDSVGRIMQPPSAALPATSTSSGHGVYDTRAVV